MKRLRISATLGIFGVLAVVGMVGLPHPQSVAAKGFEPGSTYVISVSDSTGNFVSRGVITLHADHTMSAIDSGQGGPTYLFSSQLGSWKARRNGQLTAKTFDFDLPSQDFARLDYTLKFTRNGNQVAGTITLTTFPLENGNPLDGGGTPVGTFTFEGDLVNP